MDGFLADVHKKFQEFTAGEKFRHGGGGENIAHIFRFNLPAETSILQEEAAALDPLFLF